MVDGGGRGDGGDKARDEFFSEAQELVDGLGRDLLRLDESLKKGTSRPGAHQRRLPRRAHAEGALGPLRRDAHGRAVARARGRARRPAPRAHRADDRGPRPALPGRRALRAHPRRREGRARRAGGTRSSSSSSRSGRSSQRRAGGGAGVVAQYDLDPGLLGVLTEYEEHRLRTNIQQGLGLYRIRVRFSLATIDSALDELKAKARPHGEIITYLPTGAGADIETIELEILMASRRPRRAAARARSHGAERRRSRRCRARELRRGARRCRPASAPPADGVPRRRRRAAAIAVRHAATWRACSLAGVGAPDVAARGASVDRAAGRRPRARGAAARRRREMSLRSVSQTVRVDIRKLDRLMTVVGELAIVEDRHRAPHRARARPRRRRARARHRARSA